MKLDRQGLAEAAIAGATTGIFFGCVVIASRLTTDAGDVLGFFGAAFGAGAAVLGAVFVETLKISRGRNSIRDQIEITLANIVILTGEICGPIADDRIIGGMLAIRQMITNLARLHVSYSAKDQTVAGRLEAIAFFAPRFQSIIDSKVTDFEGDKVSLEEIRKFSKELCQKLHEQCRVIMTFDAEWAGRGWEHIKKEAPHLESRK